METFMELIKKEGPILGLYVQSPDPIVVEMAKAAGFDFIRLDNEHILFDYSQMKELIRVAALLEMPCQVRISDLSDITKLLDAGATGIVVPDVNTIERAREAVSYVKYHPLGARGVYNLPSPVGRYLTVAGHGTFDEYVKAANDIVTLTIQVEDVRASAYIDELVSMPGIDMVSSGKGDISQSVGKPGKTDDPEVVEFEKLLVSKAIEHGKQPVLLARNADYVKEMLRLGVKVFTAGPDELIFANALKSLVKLYKG
jgi:4-hydroxy-2-oxoheptanedioate aldolase